MSVLLVSYDLKGNDGDYTDLIKEIKLYRRSCHAQKSVWFLDTTWSPSKVRDDLYRHIKTEKGDQLFVVKMRKNWAAAKNDFSTKWLKDTDRNWD